jgi:hypothetical protein
MLHQFVPVHLFVVELLELSHSQSPVFGNDPTVFAQSTTVAGVGATVVVQRVVIPAYDAPVLQCLCASSPEQLILSVSPSTPVVHTHTAVPANNVPLLVAHFGTVEHLDW